MNNDQNLQPIDAENSEARRQEEERLIEEILGMEAANLMREEPVDDAFRRDVVNAIRRYEWTGDNREATQQERDRFLGDVRERRSVWLLQEEFIGEILGEEVINFLREKPIDHRLRAVILREIRHRGWSPDNLPAEAERLDVIHKIQLSQERRRLEAQMNQGPVVVNTVEELDLTEADLEAMYAEYAVEQGIAPPVPPQEPQPLDLEDPAFPAIDEQFLNMLQNFVQEVDFFPDEDWINPIGQGADPRIETRLRVRSTQEERSAEEKAALKRQFDEADALDSVWASVKKQLELVGSLSSAVARWAPDIDPKTLDEAEREAEKQDAEQVDALTKKFKAEIKAKMEASEEGRQALEKDPEKPEREAKALAKDLGGQRTRAVKYFAIALVRAKLKPAGESAEVTEKYLANVENICMDMQTDRDFREQIFSQSANAVEGCENRVESAIDAFIFHYENYQEAKRQTPDNGVYAFLASHEKRFNSQTLEILKAPISLDEGEQRRPKKILAFEEIKLRFNALIGDRLPLMIMRRSDAHTHYDHDLLPVVTAATAAIKALSEGSGNKQQAIKEFAEFLPSKDDEKALDRQFRTQEESLLDNEHWKTYVYKEHREVFKQQMPAIKAAQKKLDQISKAGEEREWSNSWTADVEAATAKLEELSGQVLLDITRQYRETKTQVENKLAKHPDPIWPLQAGKANGDGQAVKHESVTAALVRMELEMARKNGVITEIEIGKDHPDKDKPTFWVAAQLEGFAVKGYSPTEDDKKALKQALVERLKTMSPQEINNLYKVNSAPAEEPLHGFVTKQNDLGNVWILLLGKRAVEFMTVSAEQIPSGITLEVERNTPPGFTPGNGTPLGKRLHSSGSEQSSPKRRGGRQ